MHSASILERHQSTPITTQTHTITHHIHTSFTPPPPTMVQLKDTEQEFTHTLPALHQDKEEE